MPDPAPEPVPTEPSILSLEAARERGFRQGMSTALCLLAILSTAWTIYSTHAFIPRCREVFTQVHIEMPLLTMAVLIHYWSASVLLVAAAVGCAGVTRLWGDRRWVLYLNIADFLLCAGWFAVVTLALFAPLISVLQEISTRR